MILISNTLNIVLQMIFLFKISGKLEFKNLKLKRSALDILDLPVEVSHGCLQSLQVSKNDYIMIIFTYYLLIYELIHIYIKICFFFLLFSYHPSISSGVRSLDGTRSKTSACSSRRPLTPSHTD